MSEDRGSSAERGRWSSRRKTEVVLRVLRGEDLDALSRELGVTAGTIAHWRDQFLAGGQAAVKSRPTDRRTRRRVGAPAGEDRRVDDGERAAPGAGAPSGGGRPFRSEEAEVMGQTASPSVDRRYGLARVCRVPEIPRSTIYAARTRRRLSVEPRKRGPKTAWTDAELTEQIRGVLARSPFVGEGHRKVWARLRLAGIRTSKPRVLRLMRAANLLAPTRMGQPHGPAAHDGTIIPNRPDAMWGIDATAGWTDEGTATVFIAVDHFTAECVGIHAAQRGTRFEALEPLRQGIREYFDAYRADVATGLALRHDHGSQFMSDLFQTELRFLGLTSSPAFVREPEGNGCAERFIRTLKERLLWIERFETVEALRRALLTFKDRYNREWLIERHGHQTPTAVRAAFAADAAA